MIELNKIYNEDCLEGMKRIPDGSVDCIICDLYNKGYTLRHIGEIVGKDHHFVKRTLMKHNVQITKRKTKKPYTEEHRKKVSNSCKGRKTWSKGKKMTRDFNIKNMVAHLKYDVTYKWVDSFDDLDKVKFLNRALSRKRDYKGFDTEQYKQYIETFYKDEEFNRLYDLWVKTGDKYIKPSLDHIIPKAQGGSLLVENLRFISWFENRAKCDMTLEEWENIKGNIQIYLSKK